MPTGPVSSVPPRRRWLLAGALMVVAPMSAACGEVVAGQPTALSSVNSDESLIVDYFERSNAAARDGSAAQKQFLERTQHPDVDEQCDLGDLTVLLDPSLSTLRPDHRWRPARSDEAPRGKVYVIAVTVTVQRDETTLGIQIGSMHVVVLDETAYGFAPCPT